MLLKLTRDLQAAIKNNDKEFPLDYGFNSITAPLVTACLDFPETPDGFELQPVAKIGYDCVVLCSGGADSTVMMELTKERTSRIALYVDFGQPYALKEIKACRELGFDVEVIKYPLSFDNWNHIIPTRNLTLIALAEQYVNHEGEIWLGAVQGESEPMRGDKSLMFFTLCERFIWQTKRKFVKIKTLASKTKNDWLKWYITETRRTDILNSITCFSEEEGHCGKCQACVRKWISMKYCGIDTSEMFISDPAEASSYLDKYVEKMELALKEGKFDHYTEDRCNQDLSVIKKYRK